MALIVIVLSAKMNLQTGINCLLKLNKNHSPRCGYDAMRTLCIFVVAPAIIGVEFEIHSVNWAKT